MISLKFLSKNIVKNRLIFCRLFSTQNILSNVSDNCNTSDDNVVNYDKFKSLATNKKIECKIKIILEEYEMYRNSDEHKDKIPFQLTVTMMKQLLYCDKVIRKDRNWRDYSSRERRRFMGLMRKYEDIGGQNQLIAPLMPTELEKLYGNRLKNAALFGQNVIFDLSFDNHMSVLECKNLAEQFHRIYKFNRYECLQYSSELPFNLNLCNVDKSGKTFKFIEFLFPHILSDNSFVNITSKSYLDVFPKQDLVYLSPHSEQVMTEYDNSAVFIIGGIVDRKEVIYLSQPKAIEENIRSVRLPIDSLIAKTNIQALDSVFRVLYDFKAFGVNNEYKSFEDRIRSHIPKFKLKSVKQMAYERLKSQELSEFSDDFAEEFEENSDFKCN